MDYEVIKQFVAVGGTIEIAITGGARIVGTVKVLTESTLGLETHGRLDFVQLSLVDHLVVLAPKQVLAEVNGIRPSTSQSVSGPADPPNYAADDFESEETLKLPTEPLLPHQDASPTARTITSAATGESIQDSALAPECSQNIPTSDARERTSTDSAPVVIEGKARTEGLEIQRLMRTLSQTETVTPTWTRDVSLVAQAQLASAQSAFDYASRIQETDPKFGRMQAICAKAYTALLAEPKNPGLLRLLGELELINQRPERAIGYLVNAAELGPDASAWRLIMVATAALSDEEGAVYAGLRYIRVAGIAAAGQLWDQWLALVRATGRVGQLRELLHNSTLARDKAVIEEIVQGQPNVDPMERPAALRPRPLRSKPVLVLPRPDPAPESSSLKPLKQPATKSQKTDKGVKRISSSPRSGVADFYSRAREIEHAGGNLEEAKQLYRLAIANGRHGDDWRESRVKDLAWLVRRTEGPVAALRVIEEEYQGSLKASDSLDNILIDFLVGAERYSDARLVVERQLLRNTISYARRQLLQHQLATIKLRLGMDSVSDWMALVEGGNNNAYARRGLALAYLLRGKTDDLYLAERAISDDDDAEADDIRLRLEKVRQGGDGIDSYVLDFAGLLEGAQSLKPPLIDYVTRHYSQQAENYIEQRQREKRTSHPADAAKLAKNADALRGFQRENSADGYISAAVIVRDSLERTSHDERASDEYRLYLVQGLVGLADVMLDREHQDAARDLYATALSVSEGVPNAEATRDVKYGFVRYFVSLEGRRALARVRGNIDEENLDETIRRELRECCKSSSDDVFDLVIKLFATSSHAGRRVLSVVANDEELRKEARRYIAARKGEALEVAAEVTSPQIWTALARSWHAKQRVIVQALLSLQNVEMSEESLQSAISALSATDAAWPSPASSHLGSLAAVLNEIHRALYERAFEEREACYRRAQERMDAILHEIQLAPTEFAVEALVPVAEHIKVLAATAMTDLYNDYPAEPTLTAALETVATDSDGRSLLQVKLANAEGRAPIESPEIRVSEASDVFVCENTQVTLPVAVRGGGYKIVVLKLAVTPQGRSQGAFSVPLTLSYRSRGNAGTMNLAVSIPIQLSTADQFVEVGNPYEAGSLGRPVGQPDMFYGRDDILDRISTRLSAADGGGTGFAIYGQKRAGKSSIRLHLAQALSHTSNLVLVDLGNVGKFAPADAGFATNRLLGSLAWQIVNKTNRALQTAGYSQMGDGQNLRSVLIDSPTPIVDCLDIFDGYLADTESGAPPRFVLVFDEFQYFELWMRRGLLDRSFMQSIKAMIERGLFDIIVIGQDALDRLISEHANVFAVFARERVTYLDDTSARRLIDEPLRIGGKDGPSRYREGAIGRILELTGGSAFYIQKFCYELVRYMNSHRAPFVTEADVEMVRVSLLQRLDPTDFNNLESSGYIEEELALAQLAETEAPSANYAEVLLALAMASREGPAPLDRVAEFYSGHQTLEDVLDDLATRDVVRREAGRYRIVVRLYHDWLLFHHLGGDE